MAPVNTSNYVKKHQNDERILATIQKYSNCHECWMAPKTLVSIPINNPFHEPFFEINLQRGGRLRLYPNIVPDDEIETVRSELLSSGLFRQYDIQDNDEPRAHFLLHPDATDNFEEDQPGYRYASIKMKSKPLSRLPALQKISNKMASYCRVEKWNIGINPVLYRDGKDRMGDHADDDQGERVILALLVDSPTEVRRVCTRPFSKLAIQDGDEYIELFMRPGDAYEMDGEMQLSYSHSVPANPNLIGEDAEKRIAVVFRTGNDFTVTRDSGRSLSDLSPRNLKTYFFGSNIASLEEGQIYKRRELRAMGAHLMQERGISGNGKVGCDAIIISGLRPDRLGYDEYLHFMYAAESRVGALSVKRSAEDNRLIRIFRSSTYTNPFHAVPQAKFASGMYRYDGLYKVVRYELPEDVKKQPFKFYFQRVEVSEVEVGGNSIPNCNILKHCENLGTVLQKERRDVLHWLDKHANSLDKINPGIYAATYKDLKKKETIGDFLKGSPLSKLFSISNASEEGLLKLEVNAADALLSFQSEQQKEKEPTQKYPTLQLTQLKNAHSTPLSKSKNPALAEDPAELLNYFFIADFWTPQGFASFDEWRANRTRGWKQSYSWNKKKTETLIAQVFAKYFAATQLQKSKARVSIEDSAAAQVEKLRSKALLEDSTEAQTEKPSQMERSRAQVVVKDHAEPQIEKSRAQVLVEKLVRRQNPAFNHDFLTSHSMLMRRSPEAQSRSFTCGFRAIHGFTSDDEWRTTRNIKGCQSYSWDTGQLRPPKAAAAVEDGHRGWSQYDTIYKTYDNPIFYKAHESYWHASEHQNLSRRKRMSTLGPFPNYYTIKNTSCNRGLNASGSLVNIFTKEEIDLTNGFQPEERNSKNPKNSKNAAHIEDLKTTYFLKETETSPEHRSSILFNQKDALRASKDPASSPQISGWKGSKSIKKASDKDHEPSFSKPKRLFESTVNQKRRSKRQFTLRRNSDVTTKKKDENTKRIHSLRESTMNKTRISKDHYTRRPMTSNAIAVTKKRNDSTNRARSRSFPKSADTENLNTDRTDEGVSLRRSARLVTSGNCIATKESKTKRSIEIQLTNGTKRRSIWTLQESDKRPRKFRKERLTRNRNSDSNDDTELSGIVTDNDRIVEMKITSIIVARVDIQAQQSKKQKNDEDWLLNKVVKTRPTKRISTKSHAKYVSNPRSPRECKMSKTRSSTFHYTLCGMTKSTIMQTKQRVNLETKKKKNKHGHGFMNKIVQLKQSSGEEYYFVFDVNIETTILQIFPLSNAGTFNPTSKLRSGRKRWKVLPSSQIFKAKVDEFEIVHSQIVSKVQWVVKESWDIVDSSSC